MLSFAAPQFAWMLAIPAAVVVLYLLRRKYVPRQVPSAFLWRKALQDHAANRPLQRLRKNLLLPVQLLAALALALGLMQPCIPGGAAGRTILVFDISGSMQAETNGRTRLDEAKARAEELVRSLPAGEEITVLAAGEDTRQLALGSRDPEEIRQAIASLACEKGGADLEGAISLAEAVRREAEAGARIVVFSDTYVPGSAVTVLNSGTGAENRAVCALNAEEGRVYARVANYGGDCTVTLTCRADGRLAEAKELQIPAGETAGVTFAIPEGTVLAEVAVREADALAADNRAEAAVIRPVRRTVALTDDSLFLESALKVRQDLTVIRISGDDPSGTPADLYITGSNPVIFTLHPEETGFTWGDEKEAQGPLAAENSPLTAGLTLKNVALRSFRPVSGGKAMLRCGTEAAAAYTDTEVIVGFDLHDTNLPLKYDFPVMVQNILDMLIPRQTSDAPAAEEPLMAAQESDVRSVAPDAEGPGSGALPAGGRNLTVWFLAAFLLLLPVEFLLARELWIRSGKTAKGGERHAR